MIGVVLVPTLSWIGPAALVCTTYRYRRVASRPIFPISANLLGPYRNYRPTYLPTYLYLYFSPVAMGNLKVFFALVHYVSSSSHKIYLSFIV